MSTSAERCCPGREQSKGQYSRTVSPGVGQEAGVGRHERQERQVQVLYLGSSAELGALRRSMEAHGVVTRSRLNPAVDAVVVDGTVAADHPTLRGADSLNIPVLSPEEAVLQFASHWMTPADLHKSPPEGHRSGWSFRSGSW